MILNQILFSSLKLNAKIKDKHNKIEKKYKYIIHIFILNIYQNYSLKTYFFERDMSGSLVLHASLLHSHFENYTRPISAEFYFKTMTMVIPFYV